jgi:MerR family transcriptional regulator, light-induced transcriptional regulator
MANDNQVESATADSCGEICPAQPTAPSGSWSLRWPGQPDPNGMRIAKVARRGTGQLVSAIEGEVIPRLILSQRANAQEIHSDPSSIGAAGGECVEEFTNILLSYEVEVAYAYIDSIRVRGVSLSAVYLELLAPTARLLGEMWEDDRCGFADVTVALCRLHEILRGLSASPHQGTDTPPLGRRVLLVPAPGEQHTFGLLMVAEFFRRSGWEVWSESLQNARDLIGLAGHEWFTLIGLSVGCESHVDGLASTIHSLRKSARNRSLGVMVGGAVLCRQPELALHMGADATGQDGRQAALQAENLVNMLASRC